MTHLGAMRLTARTATLASIAILVALAWRWTVRAGIPCVRDDRLTARVFLMAMLIVPYVRILWRFRYGSRGRPPELARGFALGLAWGAIAVLVAAAGLWVSSDPPVQRIGTRWDFVALAVYAGVQVVLAGASAGGLVALADAGQRWMLLPQYGVKSLIYLFVTLWLTAMPVTLLEVRQPGWEAQIIGALRRVQSGQVAYAKKHADRGYALTWDELLADGAIGEGFTRDGRYENVPYRLALDGARDAAGAAKSFLASATPAMEPRGECRAFMTDERGGVRYTFEPRAAMASDPLVQ